MQTHCDACRRTSAKSATACAQVPCHWPSKQRRPDRLARLRRWVGRHIARRTYP